MIETDQQAIKFPGIAAPILIASITHFVGYGNYTRMYCKGKNSPFVLSQTLKTFESLLPDFLRISKSHLVNHHHVTAINHRDKLSLELLIEKQSSVRVARRRIDDVQAKLAFLRTH